MQYQGGKWNLAKKLVDTMVRTGAFEGIDNYHEPFCGSCAVAVEVVKRGLVRPVQVVLSDLDSDVVKLVSAASNGWKPEEPITRAMYYECKASPKRFSPPMVGFLKYCCSFGGKAWGGYREGTPRNGTIQGQIQLLEKFQVLRGATFYAGIEWPHSLAVLALMAPPNRLTYFDPPYAGVTGYKSGTFDHGRFWSEAQRLTWRCFVSEYAAPEAMYQLAEFQKRVTLSSLDNKRQANEKLFANFWPAGWKC